MNSDFVARALGLSTASAGASDAFSAVVTDSRKIVPGCLFVAIPGDKFDGHTFIEQAVAQGARGVICRKGTPVPAAARRFEVEDTILSYRLLAARWRDEFGIPFIVVAGSVGKTTSKELLHAVLQGRWPRILKTQASQNGFIGVAMTLLELTPAHQAAVVEVGIDEIGAMQQHLDILRPDAGILTAIGPEHLEKLIDIPTVAREEALALRSVARQGGTIALNLDDPWIAPLASDLRSAGTVIPYSLSTSSPNVLKGNLSEDGTTLALTGQGLDGVTLPLPLLGRHNALNLLGVVALARGLGLSGDEILRGLQTFKGATGRSELQTLPGPSPVVCDYYNANPSSVLAGLDLLELVSARAGENRRTRWACLADMLELGPDEERFHRELAPRIMGLAIEHVLLFGPRMRALEAELHKLGFKGELRHFDAQKDLARALIERSRPGDAILIKGSRGMRMEEVWKELEPHARSHWSNPSTH